MAPMLHQLISKSGMAASRSISGAASAKRGSMSAQPFACRQCGMLNPPDNNFCGRCGTHLATRPVAIVPRPRATADSARNRRNIAIIYAITTLFVLTCLILAVAVIVWQP